MLAAVAAGGFTLAERQRLAAEAFAHTATYDVAVASWMGSVLADDLRRAGWPGFAGRDAGTSGRAAVRREPAPAGRALRRSGYAGGLAATAEQLHGKEMSYNNYVDTDAARRAAYDFDEPAVAIIKHANPCGIAVGADVAEAHRAAHECDPVSAFGGVIAVNRPVSVAMAEQVAEVFTEVIVAPAYDDGAVEVLAGQEEHPDPASARPTAPARSEMRQISGGLLMQHAPTTSTRAGDDPATLDPRDRGGRPSDDVLADLAFAWRACRSVKSNAILLAKDGASVGHRHGPGQPGRLLPARRRAGGGAGRRLGRRLRRVLPVRGRPADPDRRRGHRDRAARRLGARRADHRGARGRRRDDVLHRHPALRPLTAAGTG